MVKKYSPRAFENYGDFGNGYPDVVMEQSTIGRWIPLEVYQDETTRLKKQVERLKASQKKLIAMANEGIHISQLINMTSEDISNKYYEWVNK